MFYSLDGYNDFCTNKCFELVKSYLEAQCVTKRALLSPNIAPPENFTTYREKLGKMLKE